MLASLLAKAFYDVFPQLAAFHNSPVIPKQFKDLDPHQKELISKHFQSVENYLSKGKKGKEEINNDIE